MQKDAQEERDTLKETLKQKDLALRNQDQELKEKEHIIQERDRQLAEKDHEIDRLKVHTYTIMSLYDQDAHIFVVD